MDSRRIRECELSGSLDIATKCFVLGLFQSLFAACLVGILTWIADQYDISDPKYIALLSFCAVCIVFFGVPWGILREYHFHLRTPKLALIAAFAYAVGFHGCPTAIGLIVQDKYASFVDELVTLIEMGVSVVVVTAITWGLAIVACNRFAKKYPVAISRWPPKCKYCGYDLSGNQSQTCPECGKVFSYDEFGMAENEFRALQRITKPVTRDNFDR